MIRRLLPVLAAVAAVSALVARPVVAQAPGEVFVAAGAVGGDGSRDRPLGLAAALSSSGPARPGTTIWVRGGTYPGCYTSTLAGTEAAPITVRVVPGERAVVDGATCNSTGIFTVNGTHTWIWGLEVMSSSPTRTNPTAYDGTEIRPTGFNVYGPGTKLINVEVHDAGNGIGLWDQGTGAEVHGAIVYNNGWVDPSRGHGHGIYAQNQNGAKRVSDVISLNNFATGMKAFSVNGYANGFVFDGVIAANNGAPAAPADKTWIRQPNLFVGTDKNPVTDTTITDSAFYQEPATAGGGVTVGWATPGNGRATIQNNTFTGGSSALEVTQWLDATVTGNTLHITQADPTSGVNTMLALVKRATGAAPYTWNNNRYYDGSNLRQGDRFTFAYDNAKNALGGGLLRFNEWQTAANFDAASTYTPGIPPTKILVRKNAYEPGRANIAITNWANTPTATVDLTGIGLRTGQRYQILDAQNLHGTPITTGTWNGTPINVPLDNQTITQPINTPTPTRHTGPTFATLVVLPIG